MKTETGLQFSTFVKGIGRAAAWVAVTMALGLLLVIVFGSPLAASTNNRTLPGSDYSKETGPWIYEPASLPV